MDVKVTEKMHRENFLAFHPSREKEQEKKEEEEKGEQQKVKMKSGRGDGLQIYHLHLLPRFLTITATVSHKPP